MISISMISTTAATQEEATTGTSPGNCSIAFHASHRQRGGNSCPEYTLDFAPGTLGMVAMHIQRQDAMSLLRYIIKSL